ncbi:MAG: hypothetical protein ACYTFV_00840 [Planctomycetota bacterium]|jgi:hypothetical protein
MADIADHDATKLVTGTTPTAEDLNRKVYYPLENGSELGEANGNLDYDNTHSDMKFQRRHVQRGAWTRGSQSGATANVDFIGDFLFPNFGPAYQGSRVATNVYSVQSQTTFGTDELPFITIPGMAAVVPVPYDGASWIRVTWRVCYVTGPGLFQRGGLGKYGAQDPEPRYGPSAVDVENTSFNRGLDAGMLRLFVNGVPHPFLLKRIPEGRTTTVPSSDYGRSPANNLIKHSDFQTWEFSAMIDADAVTAWGSPLLGKSPLTKGYHTASLRCFSRHRILRFKTRYFEVTVQR